MRKMGGEERRGGEEGRREKKSNPFPSVSIGLWVHTTIIQSR
jgi:hypothetical protein